MAAAAQVIGGKWGATLKASQTGQSRENNDDSAAEHADEVTWLNITLTVAYVVHFAADEKRPLGERLRFALSWYTISITVAFIEVCLLLSLCVSANWLRCNSHEDCPTGLACGHLYQPMGMLSRAICLDCTYLSDMFSTHEYTPWAATEVGIPSNNLSGVCDEEMSDQHFVEYFSNDGGRYSLKNRSSYWSFLPEFQDLRSLSRKEKTLRNTLYGFPTCIYAHGRILSMSGLDKYVLVTAFLLLSLDLAADQIEQDRSSFLRFKSVSPICSKSPATLIGSIISKVVDTILQRAVPSLLPPAMIMMLMSQGSMSSEILLNGLSVAFVLSLDNIVPAVCLSAANQERIKEHFSQVAHEAAPQRAHPTQTSRVLSSLFAFVVPFFFLTSHTSNLTCETLVPYVYYRAGVRYSMWLHFLLSGCTATFQMLVGYCFHDTKMIEFASLLRDRWVWACADTVFCALVTNAIFAMCNELFWEGGYARFMDKFFWDFVTDIFGGCAAGGYSKSFGYECALYEDRLIWGDPEDELAYLKF